jgi:hypothetical protein
LFDGSKSSLNWGGACSTRDDGENTPEVHAGVQQVVGAMLRFTGSPDCA